MNQTSNDRKRKKKKEKKKIEKSVMEGIVQVVTTKVVGRCLLHSQKWKSKQDMEGQVLPLILSFNSSIFDMSYQELHSLAPTNI